MTVLRVELAVPLDRHDDLPPLITVLEEHRGLHAGATGGGVNYLGCAELWLGVALAALGEHDDAVADLRIVLDASTRAETPAIAVRTAAELATTLGCPRRTRRWRGGCPAREHVATRGAPARDAALGQPASMR